MPTTTALLILRAMPRPCSICEDSRGDEIDKRLMDMPSSHETFRGLSREYGHSEDALARHRRSHLSQDQDQSEPDIRALMIAARETALKEAASGVRETSSDIESANIGGLQGVGGVLSTGIRETSYDIESAKYPRNVRETSDDSDYAGITLGEPRDVMGYIEGVINGIRGEGLEVDPRYIGKVGSLLTTWLGAYRANLETIEILQLREEIEQIKTQLEARHGRSYRDRDKHA